MGVETEERFGGSGTESLSGLLTGVGGGVFRGDCVCVCVCVCV